MADANPGVHSGDDSLSRVLNSSSAESISEYLQLMEETESPRLFHIWSLLGAAAALLGKNALFKRGTLTVRPNLFVILVGPPAVKKSTSINLIRQMAQGTSLNYGPSDTGGQRHGIMSALTGLHRFDNRGKIINGALAWFPNMSRPRSPRDMALFSPELGRLWGSSNREMSDFMCDLYDGETLDYETKSGTTKINEPLVTLLGATTPSSFAGMMQENATTHGIISRFLLIYADTIYKRVPFPPEPDDNWRDLALAFTSRLRWIDNNRRDFGISPGGEEAYHNRYEFRPRTDDPRLESYIGRRAITLLKVAMGLCALRCDTWVIESDIELAHELLCWAEPEMRKSLSAFGRNKAYLGRQTILDFLRACREHRAPMPDVLAAAASEMNRKEAEEVIQAMALNKEITIYGSIVILGSVKLPGR